MKSKAYFDYNGCLPWVRRMIDLRLGWVVIAIYILLIPVQVILVTALSLMSLIKDVVHSVVSGFKELKSACNYRKEKQNEH